MVLLLVTAFPLAGAAVPAIHTIVKFTAPYTADTVYDHSSHSRTGCGASVGLPTSPSFNLTSGEAQWASSVTVTACTSGFGGTGTQWTRTGVTNVNFTVPTNGSYNFTSHWNLTATFTYNVSAGINTTTNATFFAAYRIAPVLCLYDRTLATGHCYTAHGPQGMFTTGSGSVPITYSIVQLLRHNTFLTAGDQYYLQAYVLAHVVAGSPSGPTTGAATATLDLSGANGAHLLALKIYQ